MISAEGRISPPRGTPAPTLQVATRCEHSIATRAVGPVDGSAHLSSETSEGHILHNSGILRVQGVAWDKIPGRRIGTETLKSMNCNDHHEIPSGMH